MSSFRIVEHAVPCQHIREYPQALSHSQEDVLHLAVKQYIPIDNPNPRPGDVTILGAHANGFPKELYEPLWEDILSRAKKNNFRIRSIWIADVAQQGQSGVLNEGKLGNEPSWNDHARDLLHLVNVKRDQMPRPIIGVGHSFGGHSLVNLALLHPRLITSLVLIDPVIQMQSSTDPTLGPSPAKLSTFRRDVWPSREVAAQGFKKSKFYQQWDSRVLDRWIQYGLRDTPTPSHPEIPTAGQPPPVTLTTTKHQEVFTFMRTNYEGYGVDGKAVDRRTHTDLNTKTPHLFPFYRPEPTQLYLRLQELRPSVLYIFGGTSNVGRPETNRLKMETTGIGIGGSGGAADGRVKSVTFEDIGHLIAMEAVDRTADESSAWIGSELQRWREAEEEFNQMWQSKSQPEKQMNDAKWIEMMGGGPAEKTGGKPKL